MSLHTRIRRRSARIAIIGLGYVGLPLARVFVDAGFRVIGVDTDPAKIGALARGECYLKHLGRNFVREMNATRRFEATGDARALRAADAVLICVPTPLGPHMEPDLSYVERTAEDIGANLKRGALVVLESTSYPGTTRDVVLPRLERSGGRGKPRVCGSPRGFYLASSPEREDPGRRDFTTRTIPKLVGGVDRASGEIAAALYAAAFETVVPVESAEVAEAAKILENTYRAVNIALVNEMKVLLTAMGIDVWSVVAAAGTKPFGFAPFYPGPGLGGHCIPIDPYYLTWKAREVGLPTRFVELAGEINHAMPDYVVMRVVEALNARGRAVRGARVLVLGLAYKPDIDDVRESPSFEIIQRLREMGARVDYNDPLVPRTHRMRRHDLKMTSVALTAAALKGYDAVVVSTAHSVYDWGMIARHARLVIDTRNALRGVKNRKNIVMA
ncbi:MAG: nucleotide sugar dehydrogenase [Phycisphaeraceae bacterium]|nr:nucleotide sugar dehydrogenase [Phycisphaeraceae bacterium]